MKALRFAAAALGGLLMGCAGQDNQISHTSFNFSASLQKIEGGSYAINYTVRNTDGSKVEDGTLYPLFNKGRWVVDSTPTDCVAYNSGIRDGIVTTNAACSGLNVRGVFGNMRDAAPTFYIQRFEYTKIVEMREIKVPLNDKTVVIGLPNVWTGGSQGGVLVFLDGKASLELGGS